jgi:sulfate adenylyltransferase subunit 2
MEELSLPSVYFSHEREVIHRNGIYLANSEYLTLGKDECVENMVVRCRTVGDMTCTGVVASPACNVDDIIAEVAAARVTERGGRADDKRTETAMEDRKKDGYF